MRRRKRRAPDGPHESVVLELDDSGAGLVERDGRRGTVHGTLPGEHVSWMRVDRRKGEDIGKLVEVKQASSLRTTPPCPHAAVCGGCSLQHVSTAGQLELKRARVAALFAAQGLKPASWLDDLRAPTEHYRRRARLGVRWVPQKGGALVGFRERNETKIAEVGACLVLAEPVSSMLPALSQLIGRLSAPNRVPQIEVSVGDDGCFLSLRTLDEPTTDDLEAMRSFAMDAGVSLGIQRGGPDSIEVLHGTSELHYSPEPGLSLAFGPTDFVQVNAPLNQALVARAIELLAPTSTSRVLDLFCGLGNFTLPLARRAKFVLGLEGAASLVDRARANAAAHGLSERASFEVADLWRVGEAPAHASLQTSWDGVLVDPPRSGVGPLVEALGRIDAPRIVYVSCGPESLARDAAVLVRDHGWTLDSLGIADMFPHTAHVESIARFSRG